MCTLKEYLAELNIKHLKEGGGKPPTMADISRKSGINYRKIMRLANNTNSTFDYEVGCGVIMAVRELGYDMQLSDIIKLREPAK